MRQLEDCKVYEGNISRLTKANSFVADGRIIYTVKKDYEGKALKLYVAYDSATKIQLAAHHDKEKLISYLQGKDLSVLGVDNTRLF